MNYFRHLVLASLLVFVGCSQGSGGGGIAPRQQSEGAHAPHHDAGSDSTQTTTVAHSDSPTGKALPAGGIKGRGLPAGAMRAQMVQIMDMNGFEQPLPAVFGFIPVGWRAQGGIQWGRQFMCTNGYNFSWMAQSPDGAQTVAILPQEKWESNNYGAGPSNPGCSLARVGSMQAYLQQLVGRLRPGAQVLGYRQRPDLAAKFSNLNQQSPSAMGEMRTWVEAGEARFAFQEQGRDMLGLVAACGVFSVMRTDGVGPGGSMIAFTGFVFPGFAASAPKEQFNPQFAEAIRQSFLPNPAWEAQIARHNMAISRVAAEEIRKRGQAISEYNDYVSLLRKQVSAAQEASDTRRQREFGEAIAGLQSYDDPNAPTGRVELSSLYNHAWRLNDGSYVLSDDASFEPFRDIGQEGRRLEATK